MEDRHPLFSVKQADSLGYKSSMDSINLNRPSKGIVRHATFSENHLDVTRFPFVSRLISLTATPSYLLLVLV